MKKRNCMLEQFRFLLYTFFINADSLLAREARAGDWIRFAYLSNYSTSVYRTLL